MTEYTETNMFRHVACHHQNIIRIKQLHIAYKKETVKKKKNRIHIKVEKLKRTIEMQKKKI